MKKSRAARLALDPSLAPHGKATTYFNWMCRCRPCMDAHAAHKRQLRQRNRLTFPAV